MDPSALIHSGSYNMAEIWPFPINGCARVGESGGNLDLSRIQLGQSLVQFADNANRDGSDDDPMAMDHTETHNGGARKRRDAAFEDEPPKIVSTSTANGLNDCNGKRLKSLDKNGDPKAEVEENSSKPAEENMKSPEQPKQDYIHVRARRGQATDSHSLAERARREKISQRMKTLQDLVPGCNKVIGKALVLDEIINYIQSLQRQVEFLSMKLEAVNSRMDPNIEGFPSKEFGQQSFDTAAVAFGPQATRDYDRSSSPEWLHMQIGGNFERTS